MSVSLGESRQYSRIVESLTPAIANFHALSGDHSLELGMLLPHLGFAQQELGDVNAAI